MLGWMADRRPAFQILVLRPVRTQKAAKMLLPPETGLTELS